MPEADELRTSDIARDALSIPAIGLVVTGVIAILSWIAVCLMQAIGLTLTEIPTPENEAEALGQKIGMAFWFVAAAISIFINAYIIYAALKMRNLEGRLGGAVAAAILAIIPCCSCVGTPFGMAFGIWALIALNQQEVKTAYDYRVDLDTFD